MKKIFSFYCCVLLSIAAWGDTTATVDGIKYILDGSNATVTYSTYPDVSKPGSVSDNTYSGDVVIPSTITVDEKTYDVTSLGKYAFRYARNVTSLSLPEGLLSIAKQAIYKTYLTELTIPNSVTTLGESCISENSKLKTITFGSHIADNNWGNWVCWRASGAYEVYMNCDAVPNLSDDITFDDEHKSRIHVKPSVFDDFVADSKWNIYNIITELGTIDGIKYLKDGRGNAYVTYPNDTEPGTSSYEGAIVIPSTVSDGSKEYKVIAIEDKAFRKANISSLEIPESVTSIGYEALRGAKLTSLTIPGSVTSLGENALRESKIASLTLSEGLKAIGYKAIYGTQITELTVPNSVTTLGESCISDNPNLTTVVFGKNVSANKWGAYVCWRSSGAYDVYMICDAVPNFSSDQTFNDDYSSDNTTVHVYSGLVSSYTGSSKWNKYNIVGDLDKTYVYLQSVIAENEAFLANKVGTDPGFYSSENPTALSTAITAAKALTKSASGDDIAAAISAMNSAKDDYTLNPLSEGYYYIESAYNGKFMKSYPAAQAKDSGIENVDFEQNLKLYFKLIKDGDDWLIQGNDPDHMYFGDPNSVYTNYPTVRVENTYKQKITDVGTTVGTGKYKIQYNDGSTLSDPYANTGGWVTFNNYSAGSADEARMYWYFRKAEVLSKTDVASKVATAVSNGKTNLNLSGYLLADDVDASDMLADGKNLLVKVASTSGLTGQNIVNNGVCANLVLTDGQPFGYTEDITATTASYSRTVSNKFGTICLPYAVSSNEDVQYYTIDRKEGSTLYLTKQDGIAAGVPAVFENLSGGSTLNITTTDATIKGSVPAAADAALKLTGTFQKQVITDAEELAKDYYISGGKFRQATNSLTVSPFRAYFTTTSGNNVKMFNLSVLEEEETAIDNAQCSMLNAQSIYDANGMKLTSLRKGLNIVKMTDGGVQKVMVK